VSSFLDSLLARLRARDETPLERVVRERFRFLEERQGFALAESSALADGALVAYTNRRAGRALVVYARERRGVWAGVGELGEGGELHPVSRETVERGLWREMARADLGRDAETLDEALAGVVASLGGTIRA
jgi:hypothetical protein